LYNAVWSNSIFFFRTRLIRIHYLVFKDQMFTMFDMADGALLDNDFCPQKRPFKYTIDLVFVNLFFRLQAGKIL